MLSDDDLMEDVEPEIIFIDGVQYQHISNFNYSQAIVFVLAVEDSSLVEHPYHIRQEAYDVYGNQLPSLVSVFWDKNYMNFLQSVWAKYDKLLKKIPPVLQHSGSFNPIRL